MSRRLLIKTCILLAVSTTARSQYVDFFQNFNQFLQPFTTVKPRNDVTKRPDNKQGQNKQKYQDAIFFENDDFLKQKENARTVDPFRLYSTTTKPKRKRTKPTTSHSLSYTTHSPDSIPNKSVNSNKIVNNNRNVNREVIRSISSSNREPYNNNVDNRVVNNGRRIDNYNGFNNNNNGYNNYDNSETTSRATNNVYGYQGINYNDDINRQTTQRTTTTTNYYNNARQTTRRTTTEYYNNPRQTTRFYDNERTTRRSTNNRGPYSQTTSNPLLNRPGVKPAVFDENKPPITNRPITSRPAYDRPFDSGAYRPVNTRPPYETERPPAKRPNTRPVNTRPPYETERPITSAVHRPVSSGVIRPGTSGVRPIISGFRPATSGVNPVTVAANRPGTGASNEDTTEPEIEIGSDEDEMSEVEKRRLYDICEQKCDEYKSARVKKVVALPLTPNSQGVVVNVSSCAPSKIPLIIGGDVVQIQQFPHMALVGWKKIQENGYSWKCGGSLVSEQHILTAGHCTYFDKDSSVQSGPPQAVQLGSALYNDRAATVLQVSLVIRHPKYKLRRSYYDVALLKLTTTVAFSDKISPACLGVPPPVGDPVIATGWGKTEYGGDSSIELRSVSIPVWDMSECRDIWGTSLKLPNGPMPDNQICAGERKGMKDTCQGDSGGPAQVQDGCAWRVVAVTSVGRSCGAPHTPALYARIPRAFIAAQVYTNVKPGRDGNSQYGNEGTNGNNRGIGNNNWSTGNNNGNGGTANNNDNNDPYGNRGVANIRPIQNDNGQNYDNSGRVQNNNGQYYGNNQGLNTNNWNNNGNNFGNNQQNTRYNNDGSVYTETTTINRNNQNNAYNNNNQNNRNVYDQSSYNNGQNYRTTTTIGYNNQNNYGQNNFNNYGQNSYNNEQSQNIRNTEYPANVDRTYETQSNGYNNNGNTDNSYKINNNEQNGYPVANRPWWTR